jgi:hypothetical protein
VTAAKEVGENVKEYGGETQFTLDLSDPCPHLTYILTCGPWEHLSPVLPRRIQKKTLGITWLYMVDKSVATDESVLGMIEAADLIRKVESEHRGYRPPSMLNGRFVTAVTKLPIQYRHF